MPPKGRKKIAVAKGCSTEIDEEFPPIEKIVQDKSQPEKSGKGRKKANIAEDEIAEDEIAEELKPELDEEIAKEGDNIGNGIANGTKMNGGDTPDDKEKKVDPFDMLLQDGKAKKEDWKLEFSPENKGGLEKMAAKPVEKESEEPASEEEAVKSNGEVLSDEAEVDIAEDKQEVEKVPEKRGRKKAVDKVAEEEIEGVETKDEPEKVVGRRGRKKAEVAVEAEEEPKKVLAKRGRKKAEAAEDDVAKEEIEKITTKRGRKKQEETEEELPKPKRGRKKAEVVVEEIADEESEEEQDKPKAKRGRKKAEIIIEDSEEEKPRATRGRKKVEVVELEASEEPEKPLARRGRKKAESPEEAKEEPEKVTGRRGRKRAEVVEVDIAEELSKAPGKKGRKRKADVTEAAGANKKDKEAEDDDDISDFKGRELRVAMTRDHEIDEMAKKASPPHLSRKEAGNVPKPSDQTFVKAKPGKSTAAKSGRKRANQDSEDSKPDKVHKEEPAKQGKSVFKKPQIPDVSALDFGSDAKTSDGKPWNFKIASWNVNGVRAWLEKSGLSYLTHEDPDILCVQETKCSDDKLPEELNIEGYHCHWLAGDKDGYSGVGLMSKTKPISITDGIGIKEHDTEGRVITAEYEKFYLVNTYVPNSSRGLVRLDYRKTWDEDFRAYLKKLDEKKPVVLCGDLNVAHEEIDIANPKSNKKNAGFTQEERDGFSALLKEGFVDTFRHLYPDEKGAYTFWTYMMNSRAKNVGWRLDYFVISERFKEHLCDSVIRKDVFGSDHCPVGLLLHI